MGQRSEKQKAKFQNQRRLEGGLVASGGGEGQTVERSKTPKPYGMGHGERVKDRLKPNIADFYLCSWLVEWRAGKGDFKMLENRLFKSNF